MSRRLVASRRHLVASLLLPEVSLFELAVPCEVFGVDRSDLVEPWYRHIVCAVGDGEARGESGLRLTAQYGLDDLRRADTIIIPAWPVSNGLEPPDHLLDALRRAHRRGARLVSLCTGAFVLAAAGVLDGRSATTHWMAADDLARRYPGVSVNPRVLYVEDGNVFTSAGTAAGIDLCLHIVRRDHGAEVANAVARRMVVPPHRDGGQAQYVEAPVPQITTEDPFDTVLAWVLQHLDQNLTVEDLADRAMMSPRTLARRFVDSTGSTPHQWILNQRVLLAQRLLETTSQPVEWIATQCGFGSAGTLRTQFQRYLATSPQAYRRTFQRAEAG